jgi:uncharacterized protein (DUF1684 family)
MMAQTGYKDSLQSYLDDYVKEHDVVKGADKDYFRFFPIDENFRVRARVEKTKASSWISLATSGKEKKLYRVYATVTFDIHDTTIVANLYQAQNLMSDPNFKDYLLLLFTDLTTGQSTYNSGRYLDFTIKDIRDNTLVIDFNKAYNPYCAYEKNKYSCPIPPRENDLPVAINAGEMIFAKKH